MNCIKQIRLASAGIMVAVTLGGASTIRAQSPATRPAFEVASIKPAAPGATAAGRGGGSASGNCGESFKIAPGRLVVSCANLARLISYAYRTPSFRVTGPDWLPDGQRFDIEATFPPGATENQAPEMLQTLLADRFRLTLHPRTTEQEVYALVLDKGGLKLKAAASEPAASSSDPAASSGATFLLGGIQTTRTLIPNPGGGETLVRTNPRIGTTRQTETPDHKIHLEAPNTTLEGLANLLGIVGLLSDTVDMTGLEGRYQVTLDFSLTDAFAAALARQPGGDPAAMDNARTDMQNAILKGLNDGLLKLGLRLEHRKGPVATLVVDHVEKLPTGN